MSEADDRAEDLRKILETTADKPPNDIEKPQEPADRIPSVGEFDVDIPDDELIKYLEPAFHADLMDKEENGYHKKRIQDLEMYHGVTDPYFDNIPWPNSSNFHVPMTQVFVDEGHSRIDDLEWRDRKKIVSVGGIGREDRWKARDIEAFFNWQGLNDMVDFERADSAANFWALVQGTADLKIIRRNRPDFGLEVHCIRSAEYMVVPVNRKSREANDCERVSQIIPLGAEDLRARVAIGQYRNLDAVAKSYLPGTLRKEEYDEIRGVISGLALQEKERRDTWYVVETYVTYYPLGSIRPVELIVTWSPGSRKIHRKILNEDDIRPYVEKYYYENHGMAFHFSLPEKFRSIQMKANYTDKQKTDAKDKASSPAGFYDGESGFDPRMHVRMPTAMHRIKNLGRIEWEPVNIAAIMHGDQELKDLWALYEKAAGFTYLTPDSKTLGQEVLKTQRANTRFGSFYRLVNYHWKRTWDKIYDYDHKYLKPEIVRRVLGPSRSNDIGKLFPKDKAGRFDISIANKSIDQQDADNQNRSAFYSGVLADPVFGGEEGNRYRAWVSKAEAMGVSDFESVVKRPAQANYMTPDEVIDRLMDGEQLQPEPGQKMEEYVIAMRVYMRTVGFAEISREVRFNFGRYLVIAEEMMKVARLAFNDVNAMRGLQNLLPSAPQAVPGQNGKQPALAEAAR